MAITKQIYEYSPSVNIKRDLGKNLRYIPTYNGQRAFEQIVQSAALGIRTFTVIGAYGSGKSTFLWALAETAAGRKNLFDHFDYLLKGYAKNQFLDIIGEFTSLQSALATEFKCQESEAIDALTTYAEKLQKKQTALIVRIDEYGKFLEYAANHNPQNEVYFLQQLAELVNDADRNILLITTLHQDFGAYAFSLSEQHRKEWMKVKGRFKEITFNEPAEQLLLIAANRLSEVDYAVEESKFNELVQTIEKAKAFPLKDYFTSGIAQQLAPVELLAGSALIIGLQRYGQNERSFFSFIEARDYHGLYQFMQAPDAVLYYLPHVYDYLIYHYYSQLTAQHNPDHRAWRLIRDNIEKAESIFDANLDAALIIIKTIGILNLLGSSAAHIDSAFLSKYINLTGEIDKNITETVLEKLQAFKLIRYREHSNRYVLFEGTDVDIDLAIDKAGRLIEQVTDISQYLNSYFTFPVIPAKRYQMEVGTPRFFEVRLSDEPIIETPEGELDGFINLIFSAKQTEKDLIAFSNQVDVPILYVYFKQIQHIREQVLSIEKAKRAKLEHTQDIVASREFDSIITHNQNLLRYFVLDKFNTASKEDVTFIYKGKIVKDIYNRRSLNNYISKIASDIYHATPKYLNEMVNKTRLSPPILTARKYLIERLVQHHSNPDLDFPPTRFPPEKTIYQSLIKEKGFHQHVDGIWQLSEPIDPSFDYVWKNCLQFIDESKHAKRSLQELVDRLLEAPMKLKRGLVDFLLPLFLLVKQSDFALFNRDGFIPYFDGDLLDLIVKKPSDYFIKSFSASGIHLSVFNKYRALINQGHADKPSNQGFIDTIKPFLSFYKSLPEYSKSTGKLPKSAMQLREAIKNSTDPEKTFFEDFPQALGYSLKDLDESEQKLERFFIELRSAITDIRTSYINLLNRFEGFIVEEILGATDLDFAQWKEVLQARYQKVKPYMVAPYLKVFLQRINSNLDDRVAWLSSLSHAVLNKQLEDINDEDEIVLFLKFKEWAHELDNYVELERAVKGDELLHSIKIEITSVDAGTFKQTLTFPKSKEKQITAIEKDLSEHLTGDKKLNIFILTKLLNEQMK